MLKSIRNCNSWLSVCAILELAVRLAEPTFSEDSLAERSYGFTFSADRFPSLDSLLKNFDRSRPWQGSSAVICLWSSINFVTLSWRSRRLHGVAAPRASQGNWDAEVFTLKAFTLKAGVSLWAVSRCPNFKFNLLSKKKLRYSSHSIFFTCVNYINS